MYRLPLLCSAFSLSLLLSAAAQKPADKPKEVAAPAGPAGPAAPAADAEKKAESGGFTGAGKLTKEQQETLAAGLNEVSNYLRGVRWQEALSKLHEVEGKVGENHYISNLRGAVYTRIKNYKVAREHFKKAIEFSKGSEAESFHPRFNLAELDFVEAANDSAKLRKEPENKEIDAAGLSTRWAASREQFARLLTDPGKPPGTDTETLIKFKLLICDIMLKKDAAEIERAASGFDQFSQTNPAYYYAQAVKFFGEDNQDKANDWLGSARKIYPKDVNEVYDDSLVEMGWLETLQ
jgi:tetratricopeptide (TPR) repeat protein